MLASLMSVVQDEATALRRSLQPMVTRPPSPIPDGVREIQVLGYRQLGDFLITPGCARFRCLDTGSLATFSLLRGARDRRRLAATGQAD
jgi:hypothetical protein